MNIVILAAGDFPTHSIPLAALHGADFIVCCDSAYHQLSTLNPQLSTPIVVIGDGDSLAPCEKRQLGDHYIQVDEQDYNDLHKAMDFATSHYPLPTTHYTLIGATGKREDHTLGNISYLVTFAEEHPGSEIEMLTDYGRFCAMRGTRTFESFPRQQVSIFTMDSDRPFSSTGLKWPLNNFHARRWWQASLNEALGSSFSLAAEDWIVVFRSYEPKE